MKNALFAALLAVLITTSVSAQGGAKTPQPRPRAVPTRRTTNAKTKSPVQAKSATRLQLERELAAMRVKTRAFHEQNRSPLFKRPKHR